jgi:hypothetical protein
MLNNQIESLEDRLARRRRLRNKKFLDKHSVGESEIILINHSPTTQSLDRKSSKRITSISSLTRPVTSTLSTDQRKSSSTINKNPELPPIENSYSKQNYLLSKDKTNSTPLLLQETKHQSLESENEKQTSSKSLVTNEQQQKYSHQDEKPVIIKETISPLTTTEKSNAIHQETHEKTFIHQDEKPVIIKETVTSTLPPIIPPTTNEKSNRAQQEIHENSHLDQHEKPVIIKETVTPILPLTITEKSNPIRREIRENSLPNRIKNVSESSELNHPSSHPQSTTDRQLKHFNFPPFHPKPIAHTTSEQIVSITKHKHQPIDSMFAKKNSLALSYLFNKRMVDAELARATSLDSVQSQQKTVWD